MDVILLNPVTVIHGSMKKIILPRAMAQKIRKRRKQLKKMLELRPDIPVVLCSGYQNKHVVDADMINIWRAFVQKPIEQEVFINIIRKALDENTRRVEP